MLCVMIMVVMQHDMQQRARHKRLNVGKERPAGPLVQVVLHGKAGERGCRHDDERGPPGAAAIGLAHQPPDGHGHRQPVHHHRHGQRRAHLGV